MKKALLLCISALLLSTVVATPTYATRQNARFKIAKTLPISHAGPPHTSNSSPRPSTASCYGLPRSTTDRPDIATGNMVHVVYLVASDAADELLDVDGTLDCSVRAQNAWLGQQSGLEWNFDTFEASVRNPRTGKTKVREAIDVTFVRSPRPGISLDGATAVREELRRLGFAQPGKRYLSFVVAADTFYCGDAFYPISLTDPGPVDGQYGQVYLNSTDSCRARDFGVPGAPSWSESIALQEMMHNDGLTPPGAPHTCSTIPPIAHVCTPILVETEGGLNLDPERFDVMYPYVSGPLSEKILDIGNDDYFRHSLPLRDLDESFYVRAAD